MKIVFLAAPHWSSRYDRLYETPTHLKTCRPSLLKMYRHHMIAGRIPPQAQILIGIPSIQYIHTSTSNIVEAKHQSVIPTCNPPRAYFFPL